MPEPTPPRLRPPPLLGSILFALFVGALAWSLSRQGFPLVDLIRYSDNAAVIIGDMLPPDTSRLSQMLWRAAESLQMALIGVSVGLVLSLPLAFLAASNTTPHPAIAGTVRGLLSFFRSVPELIWALFFIPWVGLGAPAGIMAIVIDTIGFNGRFYAEDMEQVPPGPSEAFRALGSGSAGVLWCTVLPAAAPGLVRGSLYALERGVRSSTVLGVVGAGGIGAEIQVSMDMFKYQQAATMILIVFVMVAGVEMISNGIRRRLLKESR